MKLLALHRLALFAGWVLLAGLVGPARAQDPGGSAEDEPAAQEEPSFLQQFSQSGLDSTSRAEAESLSVDAADTAAAVSAPPWYTPLIPTLDGRVESTLTRVLVSAGVEAPLGQFVGMQGRTRYQRTNTSYRQFERDAEASNFSLTLAGPVTGWAELDVDAKRDTSYDENRIGGQDLVLEYDVRELRTTLSGNRDFGRGLSGRWGVRGDVEDVNRTDKGVANDRTLAGGAGGAALKTQGPWHDFSTRYGYDRRSGERTLRDLTDDAVTERDTVWARGSIDFGLRFNLDLDARRTTFVEDRLDYARNVNGVVDTLNVPDPVGQEHESTWERRWNVDLRTRVLPRLSFNAGASRSYSESQYTFSREGLVLLGNDSYDAESVLRYAEAGSLKVRASYVDRYNDRRARGNASFRGEESRVTKLANMQLRHRVTPILDLHFDLQETLDQNVYEEQGNPNDRDRLVDRGDLKLVSDPWEWMQVEVVGTYSKEQSINIDAARVSNNQTSDLYEVRSNLILDPEGGWRFIQNYRLQIRIIDVVASIAEDRFNKQGQWDNRVEYRFANGILVDGQYVVDYRRNGSRDPARPDQEAYIYGGPRRDHRVVAGVRIPVAGFEFETRAERGFLRDDSGFVPLDENRGKFSSGVRGNWQFWDRRGKLTLNASKVNEYGPRVREEAKDYWIVNTSLRVAF